MTEELFEEVMEKMSKTQLEILFIRLYGVIERSELRGNSLIAKEASEEIMQLLNRIRKREENKKCKK